MIFSTIGAFQRRRVLLIAYYFPPLLGGGTFRPLKFAKYLPQFGWDPIVLCAEPTSNDEVDTALLAELPRSVIIKRVGHLHPKQIERGLLLFWNMLWKFRLRKLAEYVEPYKVLRWIPPDPFVTWNFPAYRVALKLVYEYKPDVLLTTTPPHSVQLVGLYLKRATGLPWIVDLRDPWTQNPFISYPTDWHLKQNQVWESQVFQRADRIISVTPKMTQDFLGLYGETMSPKICTIPNGFDPEDFYREDFVRIPDKKLRFVYVGSLYGLQRPDNFLMSVDCLVRERKIPEDHLCVEFIGTDGVGSLALYKDRAWLQHTPQRSHRDAVNSMLNASVLLLLVPREGQYIHSGKLFEYLGASRPILALAPLDSEASQIIQAAKAGVVVPPDDQKAISDAVMQFYSEWKNGVLQVVPNPEIVASFDRRQLTHKLACLLDQLIINP